MTRIALLIPLGCLLMATRGLSPAQDGKGPGALEGWRLTFSDEFDGESLDLRKWNPRDPWEVVRNQELQAYVSNAFSVRDGILRILAEKRKAFYDGATREYSSGMMTTYGKFSQQYGRFEIRCKVPKGKGLWPAFWLLPMPLGWPPEIDVMEIIGQETDRVHLTHHWLTNEKTGKTDSDTGSHRGPDFSAEFHNFAAEWDETAIRWFVDGVERHRSVRSIPRLPMYLLVNLAVGGGWPGDPDENTRFPAALEVDWVRVWEKE